MSLSAPHDHPLSSTEGPETVPSVTWKVRGKFEMMTETEAEVSLGPRRPTPWLLAS